jgi:hypothetical protein
MEFFDPPPPPPPPPQQPRRYRMPEWLGPPENLVPGVVAVELLLVGTDRVCVWLGAIDAYPTGVMLEV